MRFDKRKNNELRNVKITPHFAKYAEGSALIEMGNTHVLCTASVDQTVPKWLAGTGKGWITAEYGMLPRSTHTRMHRDKVASGGRTQEISRLIARSLRAAVNLKALGERQIIVDCDVLQADGGTRTAAITGGFVALALALQKMYTEKTISKLPLINYVSAVSVGLHHDHALLDLCYEEDSKIETDINFVLTGKGHLIEVQGTAEGQPFSQAQLMTAMELAQKGCGELFTLQQSLLGDFFSLESSQGALP